MPTCPCDTLPSDICLDIAPGLDSLPRQSRGFGEVKSRLLASVAAQPALDGWTGEAEQDLGVMLLDMWAYVLDIQNFYDAKITDEYYLGTAKRNLSTHRIIKLLGYKPRPALSASVTLVAEVDQADPLNLPVGTGFRSDAFDDEAPQIFETLVPHTPDPARNRWALAPIPDPTFPGRVLLRRAENGVPKRGVLAFALDGVAHHASQISGIASYIGPDSQRLAEVLLDDPLDVPEGTQLSQIKMRLMGLRAGPSPFDAPFDAQTLFLDTVYPQLRKDDLAVLEVRGELHPILLGDVARAELPLPLDAASPVQSIVAKVTIPSIPGLTLTEHDKWRLHFSPVRVGQLRAPAKTNLSYDDIPAAISLSRPRVEQEDALSGDFMLHGAAGAGALIQGDVTRDLHTKDINFAPGSASFDQTLQTPIKLFGNLIRAVRTEHVGHEVLGSGDAGQARNRFKLKKAPLSWIEDASAANGRRPLIDVRVDMVLWDRVETLYDAGPADRVYLLELDAKGDTWVVFGDGKRGERPTSGVGNISASYGHGAGAAKPPVGAITQLARSVKGLGKVRNPLPATGGADAEAASDIRSNAPSTVLTLGRAVSVQDFTALTRGFPGVLNVSSGWGWHPKRQRAVVIVYVAEDGGVDLVELRKFLTNMAATDTPLDVIVAIPVPRTLTLSVDIDPAYPGDETRAAALAVLAEPDTGLLSRRAVPIGGVIYRSAIVKAVQTTPGIAAVTSILLDGAEMKWAVKATTGSYLDFNNNITVA
ncbi:MAG: hypothetical protein ACSHWS_07665 [Sulfitobacter sp.]